ncbi:MAG: hypothetical protein QG675_612 [Patescibacteria group bacterium]|jgi:uncharacterized protein YdhG (YjbR/CyaY superfamily)|nr:hypothetical protein [Patescibacteria group bacterium]
MNEVDKYLSDLGSEEKTELQRIRKVVIDMVPDAEEMISYGMPIFKYHKKYLIGYSAFKNHMSIFPGSGPIDSLKSELKDYKVSKGTIQFTLDKPIPEEIIRKIIKHRIREIDDENK